MSQAERKWRRQPDERPEQILRAALEVFSEKGFRAATMDEIAAEAGITKGTIYLYFPSKEELFVAMVKWHLRQVLEYLPQIQVREDEDLEALTRRAGRELLRVMMTPTVTKMIPLVVGEFRHIPALQRLYREELLPGANLQLANLLEAGRKLGYVRALDPVIASRCLMGMMFVFVMTQEVFGAKEVTPMEIDAIVDTAVSIYFHGILERKEAR